MADLDALFRPRSVAVVGASQDANKVGGRPIAFLQRAGWAGRIVPVHPQAEQVQGLPALPNVEAIDGPIDQAIVAVPAPQVHAVVASCLARGARAIQVFSAGFGEGPDAPQQQAHLRDLVRNAGARMLGPNSLGLFNTADGYFGTFATALDGAWPRSGPVGVVTQSGAFGSYFFGLAQARGLGLSHFVATGNEADVDIADCVEYLAHDPATLIVVVALEGCRDGRRLMRALGAARAAGKPVFAVKVGTSEAGALAAATHTGSLTGADRVFDAALRDAGVTRLHSVEALVDAAYFASIGPQPRGCDLLVVTTSGGVGVLAADAAEAAGLSLPPIGMPSREAIRAIAPLADGANPVDTSAGILGDLSAYARIAARALADRPFHAVLCFLAHVPRNPAHWTQLEPALLALRDAHAALPFVVVALTPPAIRDTLESHGIAVFEDPTRAVQALAASVVRPVPGLPDAPPQRAAAASGPLATEVQAKAFLAAQGLAFAAERHVRDAAQAAAAAREIGYPVVLKIVSPDIPHKTEAGGVRLGVADEAALVAEVPAMLARVRAAAPSARIEGFLVARHLAGGVEVLAGTQDDPTFGPVVTVGAGGVLAELLDDVAVRLAPVSPAQALDMLADLRLSRLLRGWRGGPAADLHALAQQISTLSHIAWAHRDAIASIDLNPVLARADGACAVDALIVPKGNPP